jgi:hypothetical protein
VPLDGDVLALDPVQIIWNWLSSQTGYPGSHSDTADRVQQLDNRKIKLNTIVGTMIIGGACAIGCCNRVRSNQRLTGKGQGNLGIFIDLIPRRSGSSEPRT